jgi:hypothetical protein
MPRQSQSGMLNNGGSRPVPDPTILTTQLVDRGIAGLREILESKAQGDKKELEARLDGMDRAINLFQKIFDRIPGDIDTKVNALEAVYQEKYRSIEAKFGGVQTQFAERDTRVEQARAGVENALITTARDSKLAIDAALQAAEKAVGKSETATIKQIDALGQRFDDMKGRLDKLEGGGQGKKETQDYIWLVIGTLVGLGGLLIALFVKP